MMKQTPSQTVGPYLHIGLDRGLIKENLVEEQCQWPEIILTGQVFDGEQKPVEDAMVEIWQADGNGNYNSSEFHGFGRSVTLRETVSYSFRTIKPGIVAANNQTVFEQQSPDHKLQAPHINMIIMARGLLNHLYTRVYFSDEMEKNSQDPVLKSLPKERQQTLIATLKTEGTVPVYKFNIYLNGEDETIFFDV